MVGFLDMKGLFFICSTSNKLICELESGDHVDVLGKLGAYDGEEVLLILTHQRDPNHEGRGLGSCRYWEGQGCPVNHSEHPDRMFLHSSDGVLDLAKGTLKGDPIPFLGLTGHWARLLAFCEKASHSSLSSLSIDAKMAQINYTIEVFKRFQEAVQDAQAETL